MSIVFKKNNSLSKVVLNVLILMAIAVNTQSTTAQQAASMVPIVDLVLQEAGDAVEPVDELADLKILPEDTGGTHTAKVLGTTVAAYGYYIYLPFGYDGVNLDYPVLVFLHGKGERGNGNSEITTLNKVLKHGPPKLIEANNWQTTYPMIVVSPQYHGTSGNRNNWGAGNPQNLKNFIQYLLDNYRVNSKRVYLTGLSHGGNGVYDYLTRLDEAQSLIAAAAPIAAFGLKNGVENSRTTAVWAFVGQNDGTNFAKTRDFYNAYNDQIPAPTTPAKLSLFPNAGHDVWTRTYSGSGLGSASTDYDPFDEQLTDWFFKFKRETLSE